MSKRERLFSVGLMMSLALMTNVPIGTAGGGESSDGQETLDLSRVSIVSLEPKLGSLGPESKFELSNRSSDSIIYGGYSASSVSYTRQCLRNGEWHEDKSMGWCGNGLETQTLPAGSEAQFEAKLCPDGSPTRIGLSIGTPTHKRGEVVWSEAITPPSLVGTDPMPDFHVDEHQGTAQAFRRLKERNAIGELGRNWKLEPPRVAGLQVSAAEASACVPVGRYAIVQYQFFDKPAGGPNSIVFEVPFTNEWKWVGDLTAVTMEQAIAAFRSGVLCD